MPFLKCKILKGMGCSLGDIALVEVLMMQETQARLPVWSLVSSGLVYACLSICSIHYVENCSISSINTNPWFYTTEKQVYANVRPDLFLKQYSLVYKLVVLVFFVFSSLHSLQKALKDFMQLNGDCHWSYLKGGSSVVSSGMCIVLAKTFIYLLVSAW